MYNRRHFLEVVIKLLDTVGKTLGKIAVGQADQNYLQMQVSVMEAQVLKLKAEIGV